jgi:hypothetical protein
MEMFSPSSMHYNENVRLTESKALGFSSPKVPVVGLLKGPDIFLSSCLEKDMEKRRRGKRI